jgi:MFS family permease
MLNSSDLWYPRSTIADGKRLLATRALRGLADGAVSVLLPSYLTAIGFSSLRVGAIVFGTLIGSAALTLWIGLVAHRIGRRRVMLAACALMFATGIGFATVTAFWPLFVIAVVGTLNPSAGDVSLFLPVEQAALAETVAARDLTAIFSRYNVAGALMGAVGALASALPATIAARTHWNAVAAERSGFIAYALLALVAASIYWRLTPAVEADPLPPGARPLAQSRAIVIRLAALFSVDSFGGGLAIQSLLALWLFRRFQLSIQAAASFFFVTGLLGAFSQLGSSWFVARIGRIRTMAYTHIPANLCLMIAGVMPNVGLALTFLILRASMSSMDVPARQSYVMAVVPPEERAAAASVTNVPRSLASALAPLPAGALLDYSLFGWPLILGGACKVIYDVLLLIQFRSVTPPDEKDSVRVPRD